MQLRRLFPLLMVTALSFSGPARGQGIDSSGGDAPDPDALDRVAQSDVVTASTGGPVRRVGDHFEQDGHVYAVKGVNFEMSGHPWKLWDNYDSHKEEVNSELDRARRAGANVIRVFVTGDNFGGTPRIYDVDPKDNPDSHIFGTALAQLDDFLARADERGLKVLLTLHDGLNEFRKVPYPGTQPPGPCRGQIGNPHWANEPNWDWQNTSPDNNSNTWPQGPDIRPFRHHGDEILTSYIPNTRRVLANDPRIFGWDVMNEPDHLFTSSKCPGFYTKDFVNGWIGWMARHLRLYTQAPITAGTYGWFLNPSDKHRGTLRFDSTWMDYTTQGTARSLWNDLDFISIHWFEPTTNLQAAINATKSELARRFPGTPAGKPVMLEEIGQADFGWYDENQSCHPQSMPGCNADLTCNRNAIRLWTNAWSTIAQSTGVGALVWAGTDFVPSGLCREESNHRWNEDFYGLYDVGGVLKPSGQAFAAAGGDRLCTRAAFRTWDGQHWLTAQNGGGYNSRLDATATSPGANSIFTLERQGDSVGLKIFKNGTYYYVSANQGGGSFISVDRMQMLQWETFGMVYLGYVSGLGDNAVAFRTWGYNNKPYYFSASWAGGGAVNADRDWVRIWETFQMVCLGHSDEVD
jgi:hypothetical protein